MRSNFLGQLLLGLPAAKHSDQAIDHAVLFYYYVGQMAKRETPGHFEQLVLTAILSLADDAYGVSIYKKVKELARPRSVSLGAIYVTLDRMEDKGYVKSWLSDPTPARGGRSKRQYRLRSAGEKALQESAVAARRIWDVISDAWGPDWSQAWGRKLKKEPG
jgi:DNA-binding PadR family transcriptional regulator